MDGYHPEFESDDEQGEFVEQGKGADIIYKKTAIRKSDSVEFWFEYVHNTEGGFNHDEPRDGSFKIDYKKEDTLDPYDELNLNEPVKVAKVKPLTSYDVYRDMKGECVDFDLEFPTVTPEELKAHFKTYNSAKVMSDLQIEFDRMIELSIKYKLEVESIKSAFDCYKSKPNTWLQKYEDDYKEKFNILTEITIQGQKYALTIKELKNLRKSIS